MKGGRDYSVRNHLTGEIVEENVSLFEAARYAWPQKLDHELRCIMEQNTKHVEGQIHGQETTATHSVLQVPGGAGGA